MHRILLSVLILFAMHFSEMVDAHAHLPKGIPTYCWSLLKAEPSQLASQLLLPEIPSADFKVAMTAYAILTGMKQSQVLSREDLYGDFWWAEQALNRSHQRDFTPENLKNSELLALFQILFQLRNNSSEFQVRWIPKPEIGEFSLSKQELLIVTIRKGQVLRRQLIAYDEVHNRLYRMNPPSNFPTVRLQLHGEDVWMDHEPIESVIRLSWEPERLTLGLGAAIHQTQFQHYRELWEQSLGLEHLLLKHQEIYDQKAKNGSQPLAHLWASELLYNWGKFKEQVLSYPKQDDVVGESYRLALLARSATLDQIADQMNLDHWLKVRGLVRTK